MQGHAAKFERKVMSITELPHLFVARTSTWKQETAMPTAQVIRLETRAAGPRRTLQAEPRSTCVIVQLFRAPVRAFETPHVQDDDVLSGRGRDPG
jgi:hypothetical protein